MCLILFVYTAALSYRPLSLHSARKRIAEKQNMQVLAEILFVLHEVKRLPRKCARGKSLIRRRFETPTKNIKLSHTPPQSMHVVQAQSKYGFSRKGAKIKRING